MEIGAAFLQGHFEFLDEQAFAPDLRQRTVEDAVALRHHGQQFDFESRVGCAQARRHVFGLPQRQGAAAGGNTQEFHGREVSHSGP